MVDLGRRLLGSRRKEFKERDKELSEKLFKSTNPQENILGIWLDFKNLEEDIKFFFLLIAIQFCLTSILIFVLLLSV